MYKVAIIGLGNDHFDLQSEEIKDLKCKEELLRQAGRDVAEFLKKDITVKQFSPYFKEYRLGYFAFSRDEIIDIMNQLKSIERFCIPECRYNFVRIINEIEEKLYK